MKVRAWLRSALAMAGGLAAAVLSAQPATAATRWQPAPTPNARSATLPAGLAVLSAADARAYAAAFQAARSGDTAGADRAVAGVGDPCLIARLHAPAGSSLAQDQRALDRAEKLAGRASGRSAEPAGGAAGQAARDAFYHGDPAQAYALATASGERWIAGLSAYRLKRFGEAADRFSALATDGAQNDWVRSGAAFWAARSMVAAGRPAKAPALLQLEARTPYTFYGLIAERQLGLDPAVSGHGISYAALVAKAVAPTPAVPTAALVRLAAVDARAHRAAALAQLSMTAEAGTELRAAALAAGAAERPAWTALAQALGAPMPEQPHAKRSEPSHLDLSDFPTPLLDPRGGFTLDKALVYALVRQESRFDAGAVSGSGAYGLMQLTAATAARMAGDPGLARNPSALRNAAMNLRLGQDYMANLLGIVQGDLLRAVAAYNCGPGILSKLYARLGERPTDSLMVIESMPAAQTRDYVQRVLAGYWIYRQLFGQDSRTLDAVAAGAGRIAANLDR